MEHNDTTPEEARRRLLATMHRELHDLCQPLTALRCRLEIGVMVGDCASLREAVDGGLEETRRIFATVARMRSFLQQDDPGATASAAAKSGSTKA